MYWLAVSVSAFTIVILAGTIAWWAYKGYKKIFHIYFISALLQEIFFITETTFYIHLVNFDTMQSLLSLQSEDQIQATLDQMVNHFQSFYLDYIWTLVWNCFLYISFSALTMFNMSTYFTAPAIIEGDTK